MTWIMLTALLIVVLVGGAVIPRRRATGSEPAEAGRFPWFWVAFPATMLSLGMGLSDLLGLNVVYGWTMYTPLSDDIHQPFFRAGMVAWFIAALAFAVLSVLSWRRGRA